MTLSERILADSTLKGADRLVFLCLAVRAAARGRANIDLRELVADTQLSARQVQRSIRALKDGGYLKWCEEIPPAAAAPADRPALAAGMPTLEMCSDYAANGLRDLHGQSYSSFAVRQAYQSLQATAAPDGTWMFGQRRVGDWRAALESRLGMITRWVKPGGAAAAGAGKAFARETNGAVEGKEL